MAKEEGYECDVTMLAHPGWYLHQHVKEPEVRFKILGQGFSVIQSPRGIALFSIVL